MMARSGVGIRRLSGELIWHDVQLVVLVYVFFGLILFVL